MDSLCVRLLYVLLRKDPSHTINFPVPDGISISVDKKQTAVVVEGIDRQQVGQIAAEIRALRKPEPYKGKGVRYADEVVKR